MLFALLLLVSCTLTQASFLSNLQDYEYKRAAGISNRDAAGINEPLGDVALNNLNPNNMQVYRNLAISRLVKKAIETVDNEGLAANSRMGAGYLAERSDSRTPQFSALWKTRVG